MTYPFSDRHAGVRCLLVSLLALGATGADARHHRHSYAQPQEQTEPGQFDYYLLTLSWSPTYCLTHRDDLPQCGGKGFGFVLHGLWPQFIPRVPGVLPGRPQLPAAAQVVGAACSRARG